MLGLLKVLVVVAVIAVVGGLTVHWVRDKAVAEIHQIADVRLPDKVSAHAWAPLSHGKPVRSARVRFVHGTVKTVRCHRALGTYVAAINHDFSFQASAGRPKAGCPGRQLEAALGHATRVDVDTSGAADTMTLTNAAGHVVAVLRGPHS
jgi:hypothetical protein